MAAETEVTIVVSLTKNPEAVAAEYFKDCENNRSGVNALARLLQSVAAGIETGKVQACCDKADGTQAAETIACAKASVVANDTLTVCGVVFTAVAAPSSDPYTGQFAPGASNTTMGAALAAAINAHPKLKGLLTAAAVTGTVTCTMAQKGAAGNNGKVSTSNAAAFTLGSGTFAAGAVGTVQSAIRCYRGGLA